MDDGMRTKVYCICSAMLIVLSAFGTAKSAGWNGQQSKASDETAYEAGERMTPNPDLPAYVSSGEADPASLGEYDRDAIEVIEYGPDDTHWPPLGESRGLEDHKLKEVRGISAPSQFWNLNNNPYQFTVNSISGYYYTDYLFLCDSNNCLAMNFGTLYTGGANITVRLYENGTNTLAASWTGNPQNYSGLGFLNLNPSTLYYFVFEIFNGTMSGTGYVLYD